MQIGKKDIAWNYAATFFKIGSSIILLPFILKMLPSEKVGIWIIFMNIVSVSQLLDFGFNSSFTRNVTYVFSGVKSLMIKNHEIVEGKATSIDFGLLKGLISSMKWYYSCIALLFLILLGTIGTFYVSQLLVDYQYDRNEVYISWFILCIISSYSLYTFYYDSLLQGRGLIKESKKIIIISNVLYLITAALLIMKGFGLIAIVLAQTIQLVIVRFLSYKTFYTNSIKISLDSAVGNSRKEIIKVIYPNALKIGLTIIGGFTADKFAIFIGSIYLSLSDIASYGISLSLIGVIGGLSCIVINTYLPKITELRVKNNYGQIRKIYLRGLMFLILTYIIGGICVLFLGDWALELIKSKTLLMATFPLLIALIGSFNGANLTMTGNIIVTKNEVPFYKSSLLSGAATVIFLILAFKFFHAGLLSMVLVSLLVSLSYQSWKWPYVLIKDLFLSK